MLEEEDNSEDHGVTKSTQICTTDEVMKLDIDSLLLLSSQAQSIWEKEI